GGSSIQYTMALEVRATQQYNAAHTRCFISLEYMQRHQIATGDLVKITQNEKVDADCTLQIDKV
ncbi:hypothetical protein MBANPS3_001097, partial [Mucor bainieri]